MRPHIRADKDAYKAWVNSLSIKNEHEGEKLKKVIIDRFHTFFDEVDGFDLLFSGGVDSTTIAFLAKQRGKKFTALAAGVKDSSDLMWAKGAAEDLGFPIKTVEFGENELTRDLPEIVRIINTTDPVKISIAVPFYYALKASKNSVVFSGLGSEELFAGYQRHEQAKNVNEECLTGLKLMWERDMERDIPLMNYYGKTHMLPFLDSELVSYALPIKAELKIKDSYKKWIFRDAASKLGVPKKFAWRAKKAAQYGSGTMKLMKRVAKKNKMTVKEWVVSHKA
ncbi:hypothetical protein COT72_04960 [archaeon CG10_big_fil_rev_8_21_14_0_10_43_11]|nr:MAG: hypothetical protein COT72_04960 [archaeon CG10_big_fil_rev_8_21_14_0_10_43_11]